jgi:hypothetical protein
MFQLQRSAGAEHRTQRGKESGQQDQHRIDAIFSKRTEFPIGTHNHVDSNPTLTASLESVHDETPKMVALGVMKLQSSLEFLSGNIGQGAMATLASTVGAAM